MQRCLLSRVVSGGTVPCSTVGDERSLTASDRASQSVHSSSRSVLWRPGGSALLNMLRGVTTNRRCSATRRRRRRQRSATSPERHSRRPLLFETVSDTWADGCSSVEAIQIRTSGDNSAHWGPPTRPERRRPTAFNRGPSSPEIGKRCDSPVRLELIALQGESS